jgi:ketosteroid isomerase-like protein
MRARGAPPYRRAMSDTATVQAIYAAFGRGDIPAILDRLADDVRWEHWPGGSGAQRHGVPWLLERTGREDVAGFFASLAALDFHAFEPTALLEGDGAVVAVIAVDVTVRATGERFRDDEIHLWSFDADGRVTAFRHFVDTAKHVEAYAARALA